MRTKATLVLILLNVALFFFIFKFERAWRTEAALQEARRRVLGSETADIRAFSVASRVQGGPDYSIIRNRDQWMLTQPLDWPANPDAVDRIIRSLQFLENEASFSVSELAKTGQSLADYGLGQPKVVVTFTSGGGAGSAASVQTVLRIGDTTQGGNRLYVLSPDGSRIHVVGHSLIESLSMPLDQLRARTLLTIPVFEARALGIQTNGTRVRIRREGDRWLFDTIVNAIASREETDRTIKALNRLRADTFPTTAPVALPSASPTLRITLDGNNRSETLFIGDPVRPSPAAAPVATKESAEYFGQLMNGNTVRAPVFTVAVPSLLLAELRNAQNALRERLLLQFDASAVTAITLKAPGQPAITLQRLDSTAPDGPWQVVERSGPSGAKTLAADSDAVHQLLRELALLSANSFASDEPSPQQLESWGFNRPEREITLTTTGAPGGTSQSILLQLGIDTGGAVYARVGKPGAVGRSVYAVTANLAEEFPVDATEWRSRMLRELPPTARITAIKLTDLLNQGVVFETALDEKGRPTTAVRDTGAVYGLIGELRSLRAKRFIRDGFADRVIFAGDERAWRYRLDATVTLPGGAGAEQTTTSTLYLSQRIGGAHQLAGSKDFGAVFEIDQPLIDALWSLTYHPNDQASPGGKK